MANCRACERKLGLDCFNEQDCLEISNRQYYQDRTNYTPIRGICKVLQYRLE
jgi:hypothetical protein